MNLKQTKYELQHLISGKSSASYDALIQAVAHYLRSGKRTGPMAEEKHQNKAQETEDLIKYAQANHLLLDTDIRLRLKTAALKDIRRKNEL